MKDHHYFVATYAHWACNDDLYLALKQIAEVSKSVQAKQANVFRVPGPSTTTYEINFYQPQVEGVEFIDTVFFDQEYRDEAKDDDERNSS